MFASRFNFCVISLCCCKNGFTLIETSLQDDLSFYEPKITLHNLDRAQRKLEGKKAALFNAQT